jgi:hypothetical protein
MAFQYSKVLDSDRYLVFSIARMEMWRVMVAMEHRNDDTVKPADFGQRRYSIHRKGAKGAKSKQGKRHQDRQRRFHRSLSCWSATPKPMKKHDSEAFLQSRGRRGCRETERVSQQLQHSVIMGLVAWFKEA